MVEQSCHQTSAVHLTGCAMGQTAEHVGKANAQSFKVDSLSPHFLVNATTSVKWGFLVLVGHIGVSSVFQQNVNAA